MKNHSETRSWGLMYKGRLLLCLVSFCMLAFSPAKAVVQISTSGNILQFEFMADGTNFYRFEDLGWGSILSWGAVGGASAIDPADISTINLVDSTGTDLSSVFKSSSGQPLMDGYSYAGILINAAVGPITVKSGILQYNLTGYSYESFHLPAASVPTLSYGSYTGPDPTLKVVPEPSTYALIGAGALGLFTLRRRRA